MSDDIFGDKRDEFFSDENEFGEPFEEFEGFEGVDLGDEEADLPEFGEEPAAAETPTLFGLNRNFVLIGGGIALVVCIALIALVAVLLTAGPSDIDRTVTAVLATNTEVARLLNLTETQNAVAMAMTSTAEAWTDTPTPTNTPTPTFTPTEPPVTPTQQVLFVTPTPQEGVGISADAVAQTATALAQILAGGTPTREVATQVALGATPTPISALPTTGLFDEIGSGGGVNSLATAGLAALGLAAIIVVARRLRNR